MHEGELPATLNNNQAMLAALVYLSLDQLLFEQLSSLVETSIKMRRYSCLTKASS